MTAGQAGSVEIAPTTSAPFALEGSHRHGWAYWRRILMVNSIGALAAFGLIGGLVTNAPWSARARGLAVCFVYANCIGGVAALILPPALHRVGRRSRVAMWAVRLIMIPIAIVLGSMLAVTVPVVLGLIRPQEYFANVRGSLWTSFIVTTVACLAVIAYETLRSQLDAATLALRTKERDEAEARRVATEAQLASLESRVNPHFLFNTLNSIASLTHSDPSGAERMTNQLASLMRSSLDSGSAPLVTLDEELKLVRDYLDIERVRFGDRLRFTVEASEGSRQTKVPRLSLQTVVENSVKYAISTRRQGGCVAVQASVSNGLTRLVVTDDGPGFDASYVREGHGLALLKSRLAMTFGERATLLIDSRPGRTCITIEVPRSG
jgi:two-component system, LytTR family, sensor histidine kinase AlgZ